MIPKMENTDSSSFLQQ